MNALNSFHWNWLWMIGLAAVFALIFASGLLIRRRIAHSHRHPKLPPADAPASLEELIPDSKFVMMNGVSLHYVQAGTETGGDVVLLHGIGASVYIWRYLFPLLQARHRVTAFDFLGFGKSSKDARLKFDLDSQAESIAAALTELGITKAALVGSSMGGAIAFWMAKRWPERFAVVVGLGPATDSKFVPSIAQHFAVTAPFFRYTVNRHTIKTILRYTISNRRLITDAVVDRYLEPFRDRGESLRAFVAATSVLSDARLPRGLKDLKARALVIWGEHDNMVSRRSMLRLARYVPDATFIYHPTAGHHIMEDEPVYTARLLEKFFAGGDLATEARP